MSMKIKAMHVDVKGRKYFLRNPFLRERSLFMGGGGSGANRGGA